MLTCAPRWICSWPQAHVRNRAGDERYASKYTTNKITSPKDSVVTQPLPKLGKSRVKTQTCKGNRKRCELRVPSMSLNVLGGSKFPFPIRLILQSSIAAGAPCDKRPCR